jgi:hypothetical protein
MKSIAHGTCLMNGNHPPGSALARECPVRRSAARTLARPEKTAQNRKVART